MGQAAGLVTGDSVAQEWCRAFQGAGKQGDKKGVHVGVQNKPVLCSGLYGPSQDPIYFEFQVTYGEASDFLFIKEEKSNILRKIDRLDMKGCWERGS